MKKHIFRLTYIFFISISINCHAGDIEYEKAIEKYYSYYESGKFEKAFILAKNMYARYGSADSTYFMAIQYARGEGVKEDVSKAVELFKKCNYFEKCQFELGRAYFHGMYGLTKDLEKSYDMYSQAAMNGHEAAEFQAALMTIDGKGTQKNKEKGLDMLKKSARKGNKESRALLDQRKISY